MDKILFDVKHGFFVDTNVYAKSKKKWHNENENENEEK